MGPNKLPLDQILQGDCIEVLGTLPERSVDLIFADPPYNLQLQQDLWRPNLTKVDAVDDEWDRFDSFADYDQFTRDWLTACRRVLKDTGTIWAMGSYHNVYRMGAIMQDLGFWILNDVVWVKCLSGSTEVFALVNGRPIVSTIKDLARIDLTHNTIELPSYDENGQRTWVHLTGWQKAERTRGLRIELEDGCWVECTPEHRFPIARNGAIEMLPAEALSAGDSLMQLGCFELPNGIDSEGIDEAVGEFIGWYLAEGSVQYGRKGVLLNMAADEREQAQRLIELIRGKFGIVGRIHAYRNVLHVVFPGHFMLALVERFVRGRGAKSKRLAREALFYGTDFLRGILSGYLQGDGHWDERNQRWRLGSAKNQGLITDLGVICRVLGFRLHFSSAFVPYQRGQAEIIRGEMRENDADRWGYVTLEELGLPPRSHFSSGQRHSLARIRANYKLITRKNPIAEMSPLAAQVISGDLRLVRVCALRETSLKTFYDLSVSGNHVFALANGLLTHNSNPMPNFRGVRFTNAHETLLWAQKHKGARYTFNYQAMKALNGDLQMRSDWEIPLCTGEERIKISGTKVHATQKPEALLYRVIASSSNPGDVVLDPFFGTGTTGAVAKKLHRHWIGIERHPGYVWIAQQRIDGIEPPPFSDELFAFPNRRDRPRVPFGALVERGLLEPGQTLYFGKSGNLTATVLANGKLKYDGKVGSIHQIAKSIYQAPANGWDHWYYEQAGERVVIDVLRERVRAELQRNSQGDASRPAR